MKRAITQIFTLLLLVTLAVPAFASKVLADIEYFYADDGTLTGKAFNGKRVNFEYDLRGQLLAVKDAQGKDLERYTYDPAGNRLSKTINGLTTTYTYDKANQLVTSTVNGVPTHYKYDAAGRMIQAGDKSYIYNGQNKVTEVRQNGKTIAKFEYNIDGQIAKAIYGDKVEEFMWDGLALIWRSGVTYINEPYVTGGNPVMAGDNVLFNDMLGSTLAVNSNPVEMTSFGETADKNAFFTGKPYIGELGYAFLFRNYRSDYGKWQTTDPLGYPDGWNNLAYCNNGVTVFVDWLGAATIYTGFRNLQGTGGSIAYHSMRYFRVSADEYGQLSDKSQKAPWQQTTDASGNVVYDLTVAGHESTFGNHLEARYNDPSDALQNMNELRTVSLQADVSQIEFIDNFLDATANYRGNYWAEYDARPDWYGDENSGNCNSFQSMLEQIAGGVTTNIPEKAYGWGHVMSQKFFE